MNFLQVGGFPCINTIIHSLKCQISLWWKVMQVFSFEREKRSTSFVRGKQGSCLSEFEMLWMHPLFLLAYVYKRSWRSRSAFCGGLAALLPRPFSPHLSRHILKSDPLTRKEEEEKRENFPNFQRQKLTSSIPKFRGEKTRQSFTFRVPLS